MGSKKNQNAPKLERSSKNKSSSHNDGRTKPLKGLSSHQTLVNTGQVIDSRSKTTKTESTQSVFVAESQQSSHSKINKFGSRIASDSQYDDCNNYRRAIMSGVDSLGIEIPAGLQEALADRYGEYSYRIINQEAAQSTQSQAFKLNCYPEYQYIDQYGGEFGDLEGDFAGIGGQFGNHY